MTTEGPNTTVGGNNASLMPAMPQQGEGGAPEAPAPAEPTVENPSSESGSDSSLMADITNLFSQEFGAEPTEPPAPEAPPAEPGTPQAPAPEAPPAQAQPAQTGPLQPNQQWPQPGQAPTPPPQQVQQPQQVPQQMATVPPQAPVEAPATSIPVQQPQAPQEPQQPQMTTQQALEALQGSLEEQYSFGEEDAATLISDPEKILPKLAARVQVNTIAQMATVLQQQLPNVIASQVRTVIQSNNARNDFYDQYPAFRGKDEGVIIQAMQMAKQAMPTASREQVIQAGASVAAGLLNVNLQQPQQQPAPQQQQAAPQPVPQQVPQVQPQMLQQPGPFQPVLGGGNQAPVEQNQPPVPGSPEYWATLADDMRDWNF